MQRKVAPSLRVGWTCCCFFGGYHDPGRLALGHALIAISIHTVGPWLYCMFPGLYQLVSGVFQTLYPVAVYQGQPPGYIPAQQVNTNKTSNTECQCSQSTYTRIQSKPPHPHQQGSNKVSLVQPNLQHNQPAPKRAKPAEFLRSGGSMISESLALECESAHSIHYTLFYYSAVCT